MISLFFFVYCHFVGGTFCCHAVQFGGEAGSYIRQCVKHNDVLAYAGQVNRIFMRCGLIPFGLKEALGWDARPEGPDTFFAKRQVSVARTRQIHGARGWSQL
jgi:hypothetical protein